LNFHKLDMLKSEFVDYMDNYIAENTTAHHLSYYQ
jgi:hypothetical protein